MVNRGTALPFTPVRKLRYNLFIDDNLCMYMSNYTINYDVSLIITI